MNSLLGYQLQNPAARRIEMQEFMKPAEPHGRCGKCRDTKPLGFTFEHAFQPIVNVAEKGIFAHEALVRGPSGESALTVLSKVNAENRYQFDQACRVSAIHGAARLGMQSLLSINFMPNAVYQPEACIQTTLKAAREVGFPIQNIVFETLENEQIIDRKYLTEILREYQRFGFQTAIDDFGAGYSGLDLLADFQPDIIKIDMALIRDVHVCKPRQAIVKAIVDMCASLNIKVIAEGVETREEYQCLSVLGISYIQGYYFCKPQFKALGSIDQRLW